jgi:hypothetical protein
MINLCYATNNRKYELVRFVYEYITPNLADDENLILVPNKNTHEDFYRYIDGGRLTYGNYYHCRKWFDDSIRYVIDFEKIASSKLDNIILIDFDSFKSDIFHSLINKSKKTEILGISTPDCYNEDIRKSVLEIQSMLDQGYSNDQIIVMLSLAYNYPIDVLEKTLNNVRFTNPKLKIHEVKYLQDTVKFLKIKKTMNENYKPIFM